MKLYYLFCVVYVIYFALPVYGQGTNICNTDAECSIEGTKCQNGLCSCELGKVLNTEGSKCLEIAFGIGATCTDSAQCSPLISGPSVCNNKELCACAADHIFFNNKCLKYREFNETCTDKTPCYDGVDLFAMECKNDICQCSEGYYTRGEVGCRLSASADKSNECFLDIDCEDNQYCKYNLHIWGPLGNCTDVPTPALKCTKDENCKSLENSHCSEKRNNVCFCNDGFDYNKTEKICVKVEEKPKEKLLSKYNIFPQVKASPNGGNANIPCTADADCTKINNSFCAAFRQKCTCKNSFIFDKYSGHCVRALGAECSNTEPKCGVKYAECNKNNVCQCPKYFIYGPYGDKCIKPTREFSLHSCGSDENCYAFGPHATCTKVNSTDLITTCNCKSNSAYEEDIQYCVEFETSGKCKNDCEDLLHSECINGVCKCLKDYVQDKLLCLPNLGAKCSLAGDGDCVVNNATCHPQKKICECNEGFFQTGPRECTNKIESPEEGCTIDIQCINLLDEGGICVNETCSCEETHVYDEVVNKCILKRNIGEQCESARDCYTLLHSENVVCRNNKCDCAYDYQYSEEKEKCVHNSANPVYGQFMFFVVVLFTTFIFFL